MVTNATIEALLGRRSIRKFKDEAIDDDTRATLETVVNCAPEVGRGLLMVPD